MTKSIQPGFNKILDTCPIISGQQILNPALLGNKKATDRYKAAIAEHFKNVYPLSSYIKSGSTPATIEDLKAKIRRAIGQDEYGPLNVMTEAEKEIENYLIRTTGDPTVADIIVNFNQSPYGWSEVATVYWLNELVRRHLRAYSFAGNPNVDKNIMSSTHDVSLKTILGFHTDTWRYSFLDDYDLPEEQRRKELRQPAAEDGSCSEDITEQA